MSDNAELEVRHEGQSFNLYVAGVLAGHADYSVVDGVWDFDHTVVLDEFQGKGLSKPLIKGALDAAIAAGQPFVGSCSAVVHFLDKNPEYVANVKN